MYLTGGELYTIMQRHEDFSSVPTSDQLFALAGICMRLGKQAGNRLSTRRVPYHTKFFKTDYVSHPIQQLSQRSPGEEKLTLSQSYLGYARLYPTTDANTKNWELNLKEVNTTFLGSDPLEEFQIHHTFHWSDGMVHKARRHFRDVNFEAESTYENYQPVIVEGCDFNLDILHVIHELHTVTGVDVDNLGNQMSSFQQAQHADRFKRQYEPRTIADYVEQQLHDL